MAVRKNTNKSSLMLTEIAIKGIQDKKGKDITTISLKEIEGSLFDYYIVCTGNSPSHIDSITDAIEQEIKQSVVLVRIRFKVNDVRKIKNTVEQILEEEVAII